MWIAGDLLPVGAGLRRLLEYHLRWRTGGTERRHDLPLRADLRDIAHAHRIAHRRRHREVPLVSTPSARLLQRLPIQPHRERVRHLSRMREGGLLMIRNIILIGCVLGAVVYAVAWVVLAFPVSTASYWISEGRRVAFHPAPDGSSISLYFGANRWVRGEMEWYWRRDYWMSIRFRPYRFGVSLYDFTEGSSNLTFRSMSFGGFSWGQSKGRGRIGEKESRRLAVPTWFPFVVLSAYPTLVFIRGPARRWRRRRRGLCLTCGYNLEGNVSGVCPECGSEIAS